MRTSQRHSDLAWENYKPTGKTSSKLSLICNFTTTPNTYRAVAFANGKLPSNYHLTFSRSENTSDATVRDLLKRGVNVAVVYWKHLPETDFGGFEVINGDENDLRFADPLGKVVPEV